MRHLFLAVPIVALSGCSFLTGGDGYGHSSYHDGYGHSSHSVAHSSYNEPVYTTPSATAYGSANHSGHSMSHSGSTTLTTTSPSVTYHTPANHGVQGGQHGGYHGLRGMHKPKRKGYAYGNLGLNYYSVDVGPEDIESVGLVGRVGYQSAGILGAEVEGNLGLKNDSFAIGGTAVSGGLDYSGGAFAVARMPIGDKFSVHARGGYHVADVDAEIDFGPGTLIASDTVDDFAYGVGGEYKVSERDSVRLDYTRYELGNSLGIDAADSVSLAYNRRF
jgi:hypothetical protein